MTELIPGWPRISVSAAGAVVVTLIGLLVAWKLIAQEKASNKSRHKLPPGPRPWPLLGNLALLGPMPHESLFELSKQYGPLMSMTFGSVKVLVVSTRKYVQEILKTHDQVFSSRPNFIAPSILFYGKNDIAFAPSGQHWRYARKVVTLGLLTPRRISEFREIREREVVTAIHFILKESGQGNAVNVNECMANITINNMTQMMMNKSYLTLHNYNSGSKFGARRPAKLMSLPECFQETFLLIGGFNIADYVPILRLFDPQGILKRAKELFQVLDPFLENIIEEHRQKPSVARPEDYKEDFVDALLGIGGTTDFEGRLSDDGMKAILLDMVIAAGDTSSVTALWGLAELLRNPSMMRKVQEELDSVVGRHRLVQEEDIPQLEYLNAVVKETLRLHAPGPILIPHVSTEDVEIEGFHVAAGTQVHVNVWGVHRDPEAWERPLEFDPDRFLNSTTDFKGLDYEFIPFGSGRRRCPGMNLGTLMVLYPLAMLLHTLDITLPGGQKPEELDMSQIFGLVLYKRVPLTILGTARLPDHVLHLSASQEQV